MWVKRRIYKILSSSCLKAFLHFLAMVSLFSMQDTVAPATRPEITAIIIDDHIILHFIRSNIKLSSDFYI